MGKGAGAMRPITPQQNTKMRLRMRLLAAVLAVGCLGGLTVRLFVLMLRDPGGYAARAADQQLRGATLPAARGEIYSADGTLLAASETCWTIRAAPREMADDAVESAARALSEILELDYADTLAKFSQRTSNDCLLRRRVDKTMADAVRDWCRANGVDGIQIRQDTRRVYPQGDFMGGILGFTDVDNAGLWGLELRYNDELTGQNGRILTAKNAWGYDMPTHYQTLVDAVPGSTLTLTIDANIQHWLESALSAAVTEHHVAERGVGIVMDVHTGAVLAMSCQPDYDPNAPRTLINKEVRDAVNALTGEERSAALQKAQQAQWRNKAISDLYEPGSVFKLITASAALDSGACKATDYFTCAGKITVAGTRFRCANGHIHGTETFARGLAVSCNPCFIQIGARLGKERFCDYFAAFGLREATGIDLPGESRGQFHNTSETSDWNEVALATASFGQRFTVTPMQMITMVSAIVDDGKLKKPYVVKNVLNADGTIKSTTDPEVLRQVISEDTSAYMREAMEQVVAAGTGKNAYVTGYRIGGKTATSEIEKERDETGKITDTEDRYTASFIGVAPMDDPQIAVLVAINDLPESAPHGGGAIAAPVVGRIMEDVLPYIGVTASYDEDESDRREQTVPNVIGMTRDAADEALTNSGFEYIIHGEGETVTDQVPSSGIRIPASGRVILYMGEEKPTEQIEVPDVSGMDPDTCRDTLEEYGLYLKQRGVATSQITGDTTASSQSPAAGTKVSIGSVITVEFSDTTTVNDR